MYICPYFCSALRKLEEDKGIVLLSVEVSIDKAIDDENRDTKDFLVLENHIESSEEVPQKTKVYFSSAADTWDADFYEKVNDNVYVNIDKLGAMLASHWDKPQAYIGCMKSGEVFSNSYFRHASGEMYVITRAVTQFISINNAILHVYAHEDVSVGSWMLGLSVKHIDEHQLCCSSSTQACGQSIFKVTILTLVIYQNKDAVCSWMNRDSLALLCFWSLWASVLMGTILIYVIHRDQITEEGEYSAWGPRESILLVG